MNSTDVSERERGGERKRASRYSVAVRKAGAGGSRPKRGLSYIGFFRKIKDFINYMILIKKRSSLMA